jgi:hypothetical protein
MRCKNRNPLIYFLSRRRFSIEQIVEFIVNFEEYCVLSQNVLTLLIDRRTNESTYDLLVRRVIGLKKRTTNLELTYSHLKTLLFGVICEPPNLVLSLKQRQTLIKSIISCQKQQILSQNVVTEMLENSHIWFKSTLNEFGDCVALVGAFDESCQISNRVRSAQISQSFCEKSNLRVCSEKNCSGLWDGACKKHHIIENTVLENLRRLFAQFTLHSKNSMETQSDQDLYSVSLEREAAIDAACKKHPFVVLQKVSSNIGAPKELLVLKESGSTSASGKAETHDQENVCSSRVYYRLPKCKYLKCTHTPRFVVTNSSMYDWEFYCEKHIPQNSTLPRPIFKQNHNIILTSVVQSYSSIADV